MRLPIFILALFAVLMLAAPSHAQLTYPGLLPTPTPLHDSPTIGGLLLQDSSTMPEDARPARRGEVSTGYYDESTLHTNKAGRGVVDDFHSNGRYLALAYPVSERVMIAAQSDRTDVVGVLNEGHSDISFRGRSTGNAFEASIRGAHGRIWRIGAQEMRLTGGGESDIYQGVFHFFSDTPPYRVTDTQRSYWVDGTAALRPGLWAEFRAEEMDHPSDIQLYDRTNGASLMLPLGYQSQRYSAALRARLNADWSAAIFGERWLGSGSGDIDRELGRQIGDASAELSGDQFGLIANRRLSGVRRLALSYGEYHTIWKTAGVVPNGGDLSLNIPLLTSVRYDAYVRIRERSAGLDWEHTIGAAHRLRLGYRWLEVVPYAEANDSALLLIFRQGGHSQTDTAALHAHVLQAQYSFPLGGLTGSFGATQAIPIENKKHSSPAPAGPPGPPSPERTSSGGYRLDFSVSYPL